MIALCGGVGGAKLAFGLTRVVPEADLTIVVNTGDDFEHLGLHVSPDIDTVLYTLSGLSDRTRGWGLAGETWNVLESLRRLGGEDWFQLGDHDLAMHLERSWRLRAGESLSQITSRMAGRLGLGSSVTPMSDDPVRTIVDTTGGPLAFQRYFVQARAEPTAVGVRFEGVDSARPSGGFSEALRRSDVAAVIICPSNPYLSVDPILAIDGVRDQLVKLGAPIVAVSPIIAGKALKGPAAKLMRELAGEPGVAAVAQHYRGLLDGLVIDEADTDAAEAVRALDVEPYVTRAIMVTDDDRVRLARETLAFAAALGQ